MIKDRKVLLSLGRFSNESREVTKKESNNCGESGGEAGILFLQQREIKYLDGRDTKVLRAYDKAATVQARHGDAFRGDFK